MGVIDILTGGSNSGGSSGSTTGSGGLSSFANMVFPGLGNWLNNFLGGIRCIGNQSMTNATYDEWLGYAKTVVEGVAQNYEISWVQGELNQWAYQIHMWMNVDLPKLQNPCSKDICNKCIQLLGDTRNKIFAVYNTTDGHWITIHGVNVMTRTLLSRKPETVITTVPTTQPPTNPTQTPPTNPPTTQPPYNPPTTQPPYYPPTTEPPYYPPATEPPYYPPTTEPPYNPPTTQPPYYPPTTTTDPNQIDQTRVTNLDGSVTITWYKGGVYWKTQTVPGPKSVGTTNLTGGNPIDIGGQIGDWTFGASNNQNQNMYLIGGAVGLGALFLILNKNKK